MLPGERTLSEAWSPAAAPVTAALLLSVKPRRLGDSADSYAPGAADDLAITSEAIDEALTTLRSGGASEAGCPAATWLARAGERACLGAVCLRTLPNDEAKRSRDWTGSNPPYLTGEASLLCRQLVAPAEGDDESSAGHLLVDLPSVDREDDGGALIAHRSFFGVAATGDASKLSAGAVLPVPKLTTAEAAGTGAGAGTAGAATPSAGSVGYMPRRTVTELCFFPTSVIDGLFALNLQCANIELDAAPSRPLLAPLRCVSGV